MKKISYLFLFSSLLVGSGWWNASAQKAGRAIRKEIREERQEKNISLELTRQGILLFKERKLDQAIGKFEEAIRVNSQNARAHAFLAQIAFQNGNDERARNQAMIALAINPQLSRAHYVLGRVFIKNGKEIAGFDQLQKAKKFGNGSQEEMDQGDLNESFAQLKEKHPGWFRQLSSEQKNETGNPPVIGSQPVPQATQVKPVVAVFTFEYASVKSDDQKWGESLSEMLTTAMINSGKFKVIERSQLNKVLEEQALGQSGALDTQTAAVVGKIMDLDAVIVGTVSQLNNKLESDGRVINVNTGEAITAANASVPSADQLRTMANSLAENFTARLGLIQTAIKPDSTRK